MRVMEAQIGFMLEGCAGEGVTTGINLSAPGDDDGETGAGITPGEGTKGLEGDADDTETNSGDAVDVGHAGIHQFPGVTQGKSQFFDGEDLVELSDTDGVTGVLQKNGNTRYVIRASHDVGVDRTTGLPTNVYTVIRKPNGSVLTMYPGTSPMS
jgi:hypothetical protein